MMITAKCHPSAITVGIKGAKQHTHTHTHTPFCPTRLVVDGPAREEEVEDDVDVEEAHREFGTVDSELVTVS